MYTKGTDNKFMDIATYRRNRPRGRLCEKLKNKAKNRNPRSVCVQVQEPHQDHWAITGRDREEGKGRK